MTGYRLVVVLLFSFLFALGFDASAQAVGGRGRQWKDTAEVDPEHTYNTSRDQYYVYDKDLKAPGPTRIYVSNTDRYLTGNRCMTDFTLRQGYVYLPQGNYDEGLGGFGRFWWNAWQRTRLTFLLGPGWSSKAKKHVEKCRKSSGDFKG